jgi:hypothetical protein
MRTGNTALRDELDQSSVKRFDRDLNRTRVLKSKTPTRDLPTNLVGERAERAEKRDPCLRAHIGGGQEVKCGAAPGGRLLWRDLDIDDQFTQLLQTA